MERARWLCTFPAKMFCATIILLDAVILHEVLVSATSPWLPTISSLGSRAACDGEDITLTCDVLGTGRLTWVIGPDNDTIVFSLSEDSESLSVTQHDSTGQFSASLTHFSRNQVYSFLGNLISTLHTQVDSSITHYPVTIFCNDGVTISAPFFIRLASMHCFHYYVLIISGLFQGLLHLCLIQQQKWCMVCQSIPWQFSGSLPEMMEECQLTTTHSLSTMIIQFSLKQLLLTLWS